jgi:peptidoglycan/xylan/chitin deacetylase (PgdA/CDA1 family)
MNTLESLLLKLYYHGAYPYRAWLNQRRDLAGRAPIMVLMYHRVANDRATPWTTSERTFARQIRWLRRHFDLVSLAEAQARIRDRRNYLPCVSITFDDGYADNCRMALPLLAERRIPCTYFVSTRFVESGEPFPHDVARGLSLRPNTAEQLREMAEAGVEVAGHTRTHANLGPIASRDALWDEIVGGAQDLEAITGRAVRYFAFPFGQYANLNSAAFGVCREAGFDAVCSAYGGFNFAHDDPFHIQRIAVDDDLIRLKNWVTVDPRKLTMHPRFEYASAETATGPRATADAA